MAEKYDTFLSYNREDEMDVRTVYEYLLDSGLKVWFDIENISPGDDWLDAMQDGMTKSRTCLVFFRNEPGPWHKEETKQAMRRKIDNPYFKVIPVLLPGGKEAIPKLPPMLKGSTWVDLRSGLFNVPALRKLVQAIQGGSTVPIHLAPDSSQQDDDLPTGYKADVSKIISLLIGESLYKQRYVSIRETIQNAVDACERRSKTSFGVRVEIEITINTKEGYFQVSDNGEGMNPFLLSECFAVIGKSIRDEDNVLERTQADKEARLYLIGKFGIGFISTYILAKKVWLSTTFEGFKQINLEINGISEPFVYQEVSRIGRRSDEIGTTVRVYLKDEFLPGASKQIDMMSAVQEFCRHVQYLKVTKDNSTIAIGDNWNTKGAYVLEVVKVPYSFELHLGVSNSNMTFLASNAGFLISKSPEAIVPPLMPQIIGGEINFFPGIVDLNMARDSIIENDVSSQVRASLSKAIKSLLKKAVAAKNEKIQKSLRDILMVYLERALQHEENKSRSMQSKMSTFANILGAIKPSIAPPPLSSTEAAELLLDTWIVKIDNKEITFRDALRIIRERNKNRVYWYPRLFEKPIPVLFKESLIQRGFLVIKNDLDRVEFRSGEGIWTDHLSALRSLSKRYGFEMISIEQPWKEDIEVLLVAANTLSSATQRVIHEIEKTKGKDIRVGKLRDAPAAFHLAGYDYLNLDNDVFRKANASSGHYDTSSLKAYILGLLQYELT